LNGTLTNGLLRDLGDIDKDYMVLASAIGPSHAYVHVVEFNTEVNLFGLKIKPNDIIHADRHGAVIIPRDALKMLPKAIQFMKNKEEIVIKASKEKDFNFEKLKIAWQKANSMIFKN
jgi:regulator of RNase E activity RraA